MPTKPLERLIFTQGGNCFFCRKPLGKAEASVEHLVAVSHGGKDNDENCVACCKALNSLFGRMSLKEKLQIVLNQKGGFACPASNSTLAAKPGPQPHPARKGRSHAERIASVVADLQKRGNARPSTVEKLLNTIKNHMILLGEAAYEADALLGELRARSSVKVSEDRVSYVLPSKDH
jgi:hypothetical protein